VMDETKLSDDVREDGERVQVVATHRVIHPVEHPDNTSQSAMMSSMAQSA
jgi:hypothetical protein